MATGRGGSRLVFDRWYTAHESGDTTGLATVLADGVEIHSLFRQTPVVGRADAVAHFTRTTSTFTDLKMSLSSDVADAGEVVFAEVVFSGAFTGHLRWAGRDYSGTHRRIEVPGALIVHVHEGQVTSVRTLFDRDVWLRQCRRPS